MGCVQSCITRLGFSNQSDPGGSTIAAAPLKEYSWDRKRETIDASKFIIQNIKNEEIVRLSGSIGGELQMFFQDREFYKIH